MQPFARSRKARAIPQNPTEILQSFKNRRLWRKSFSGKILQAVTVTEGSRITVISGYYLRKTKK